jgi:hypothetical protein
MGYPKIVIKRKYEEEKGMLVVGEEELCKVRDIGSAGDDAGPFIETRSGGNLAGLGFYLGDVHDWVIVIDSNGYKVLLPLKKKDC